MMFDAELYTNEVGVERTIRKAFSNFKPPEKLLPSEYCERHVKIPAGNAKPGAIRFKNAPYQVEPLDMTVNPDCERISLMWGAQTGKSQVQLMAMGFFIDHDPQSIMHMQPSQNDLQTWLTAKFDPMVDTTPTLKAKIAAPRGREGVNNQRMKQYPGGFLMFAWAGSPKTMRGRSAPKIFPDEIDGYEQTKEGSAVQLLWQRAATFGDQRLLFETSTPTIKGASNIETAFEEGDQRRWYCPCPHCGHKQYLKWSCVSWPKDEDGKHLPDKAAYVCEDCGAEWDDVERFQAIRNGEWIAEKDFLGHASYHLPEMASTFRRLRDIVKSFLSKKASGDLQTFINVSLAETWEEEGEKLEPDILYNRREHYPAEVPVDNCVLTAAVDTQDDRFEIEVVAWAAGEESYRISYERLYGDLSRSEIWDLLAKRLKRQFVTPSGLMLDIKLCLIDSGGHYTDEVYQFSRKHGVRRFVPIKGHSQSGKPVANFPRKRNDKKVYLTMIGTDTAKEVVTSRLQIFEPGEGYCHYPIREGFDEEYFKHLTNERRETKIVKGRRVVVWNAGGRRNEPFDTHVYNLAAIRVLQQHFGVNLSNYTQEKDTDIVVEETPKPIKKKAKPKRVSNFLEGWQ